MKSALFWIAAGIWMFISLYFNEHGFMVTSVLLMVMGAWFGYVGDK